MFAQTTSSATVTAISAPASYLVIDIETGHAPETAIQAAINSWKPAASAKTEAEVNAEAEQAIASWSPPSNIRDASKIEERRVAALAKIESDRVANLEKIVERKAEAVAKIRDKSALLDSAPILCIGVQTQHGAVVFNGMSTDNFPIGGVQCLGCGDEKDMLVIFRQWIDIYTDQSTVIVGQNVRGFDLPKLRSAFMRYHIKLPALLAPKIIAGEQQSIVDTAFLFKSFSVEHRDDFCPSLDSICTGLGIPRPKGVISGAAVPNLHKEGRYQEILTYNAIDVAATTRAYLLMSGQADDLTQPQTVALIKRPLQELHMNATQDDDLEFLSHSLVLWRAHGGIGRSEESYFEGLKQREDAIRTEKAIDQLQCEGIRDYLADTFKACQQRVANEGRLALNSFATFEHTHIIIEHLLMNKHSQLPDLFQPQNLEFNETPVRTEGDMVCLTDLWAAAGQPEGKSNPYEWKRRDGKQFIDFVAKFLNTAVCRIWNTTRGRHGGSTFAHWQVALAYAKYLDHGLHMRVNETYARVQGGDPTIIDQVFEKQSSAEKKRIAARLQGKVARSLLTDTLKEHGVVGIGYAQCTDAIYEPLIGGTAKEIRATKNLPANANVRETLSHLEIAAVMFAEALADKTITEQDINGNARCRVACKDASTQVATLLQDIVMLDDDAKTESLAYAVNCDRKCLDLLSYVAKLDAAIRLLIAIIDDPSITRRAEKAIDQLQCDVIHAKRLIDKRIERIANPLQLRNERQLELQL